MRVVPFIADSAAEAVARIREQLGPSAVVLNVRKLPAAGLARIWSPSKIEVLACVPDSVPAQPDPVQQIQREIANLKRQFDANPSRFPSQAEAPQAAALPSSGAVPERSQRRPGEWCVVPMLESIGVLPLFAQRALEMVQEEHGIHPPAQVSEELTRTKQTLSRIWTSDRARSPVSARGVHVFIGPPSVGKTTVLSKWLAQASLLEGRPARVFRLDGYTANTAESLSIYGEVLGVSVERFLPQQLTFGDDEVVFVDLPGVSGEDGPALPELDRILRVLVPSHIHLVLNAAYEVHLLLSQARSFSRFAVNDLIVTHLDEETRWGKLLNLVLGTKFTLGYLSSGQNVPGDFRAVEAEEFLNRVMR